MKKILFILLVFIAPVILQAQPDKRIAANPAIGYDWRAGFLVLTEVTGGLGLGVNTVPYSHSYWGVTAQAGYQFTRNIRAGAGTGIHLHKAGPMIPLFIDAHLNLNSQGVVPYLSASGGLAFSPKESTNMVWVYINPALGVRFVTSERRTISVAAGVLAMSSERSRNSFINLRLGVGFRGGRLK